MNKQAFWAIENVSSFKGHDVVNGEVEISDEAYGDIIDETNAPVVVCGMSYCASRVLEELDPIAWRCGKGDEESRLQAELEDQLENEDSDDIEFIDGDEFELDEE